METKIWVFCSTLFLCSIALHAHNLQTYIIQLHPQGFTSSSFTSKLQWHRSFLQNIISSEETPSSRLLYSYRSAMEGFAAQLSELEVESLRNLPDVIAIRPDRRLEIHTTHSYKFLGLHLGREGAWFKSRYGHGSIIGVLDTGIWPESPSFDDRWMPQVPKKWKGICQEGQDFNSSNWNQLRSAQRELELVYVKDGDTGSEYCFPGSLPEAKVHGRMVVCDRGVNARAEKGQIVKEAGGAAMILANTEINQEDNSVDVHVLPATVIGYAESVRLKSYMNSTRRPSARIEFGGTVIGKSRAPAVAQFSSRGPSLTDPSILKPDIVAPGVNIIAAWPQNLGPSGLPEDTRRVNFTVMSGTSMACPHVSGLAALVHAAYPKWSPAAIKSALMTTADVTDHFKKPIMDGNKPAGVFSVGAGHVNPERAVNPGLLYDIRPDEYITYLCTLGYTRSEIFTITHKNVSCREILQKNRGFSLNYPSISVIFKHGQTGRMIERRLTNVGGPNSVYSVEIMAPEGVKVRVKPRRLAFKYTNQSLSYKVWFVSKKMTETKTTYAEGHLIWVNSHNFYRVRSPLSVTWA
ncbi:Peptidase S8/S53 domain [Dillenia turbinata]|uniref:Peptidase S8/S53 domain n=1 Tax=Dillenia turbinata TaxID=194707 RepID=A0AAN8VPA4_9MAGN